MKALPAERTVTLLRFHRAKLSSVAQHVQKRKSLVFQFGSVAIGNTTAYNADKQEQGATSDGPPVKESWKLHHF